MTQNEVKDLFEHYRERKTIAEYKQKQGITDLSVIRLQAVESCMASLPEGLGEILRMIYLERLSLRQISKRHYFSKDTIARRRDDAVRIIAECLGDL